MALKRAARPAFECDLLHARSGTALIWWRGHRAIGDDGRCPTIARLGVSSLDLASPAPTGGALFAPNNKNANRAGSYQSAFSPSFAGRSASKTRVAPLMTCASLFFAR